MRAVDKRPTIAGLAVEVARCGVGGAASARPDASGGEVGRHGDGGRVAGGQEPAAAEGHWRRLAEYARPDVVGALVYNVDVGGAQLAGQRQRQTND